MTEKICCWALAGLVCISIAAHGAENNVKVSLISDTEIAVAGSTIRVGVSFAIPEGGHIYWRNPGDSGLATGIDWVVEKSVSAGELQWPAPRQFVIEGLDNEAYFGYEHEVLLFSEFNLSEDAVSGSNIVIHAKAYWLLCLDSGVCIPEDKELEISIPVEAESRKAYESIIVDRWAAEVPKPSESGRVRWSSKPVVSMTAIPLGSMDIQDSQAGRVLRFIPNEGGAWTGRRSPHDEIIFTPDYKDDKATGGVLILPLADIVKGTKNVRYLVVEPPKTP